MTSNSSGDEFFIQRFKEYDEVLKFFVANLDDADRAKFQASMFRFGGEHYPRSLDVLQKDIHSILTEQKKVDDVYVHLLALTLSRFDIFKKEITDVERFTWEQMQKEYKDGKQEHKV